MTTARSLVVVKVGGSIQDDPAQLRLVAADAAALSREGLHPVLVHGGGKAISAAMKAAGLTPRFVRGQRYTDPATLEIVERCLCGPGSINEDLVTMIEQAGAPAIGLHSLGACVLHARRSTPAGSPDDLGLVGDVTRVGAPVIRGLCTLGIIPVIAPVALADLGDRRDADERAAALPLGARLNVNADLAAGAVAAALRPAAFILVSDTPGIRTGTGDYAAVLARAEIDRLTAAGVIDGGMRPKVEGCAMALDAGVACVLIVDGRRPGALRRAVLQPDRADGTRLTP
jgi:acetylglutamate kinase